MEPVKYRYSVVSFIDLPYKEIKWYICVPYSWVRSRITTERVVVAYPTESPEITRKRVKKRQKYVPEWKEYTALLRYETDYFDDAEIFIQTKTGPMDRSNRGIVLPTTSSSDRKRRSYRRKYSSNPKMKPQMSVAPFKGDEQSVMKLTIRRTSLPVPKTQMHKNRPKTKKTSKITNRFECTNENDFGELHRHERHDRESFGEVDDAQNPADGTDQSVNPRKMTEQEFMNKFCDLMSNFNTICTDTRSMINDLNDTFIKSEKTLENVLKSVNNYSESNSNTTAFTSTAGKKRANQNQNRKDNEMEYNFDNDDDDIDDKDYDNDAATDSDDDSTDDVDKNDDYISKNKAPKIKRYPNIRTFVLPPEYDPNDSKWTLKHRSYKPGLVIPQSGVFVDAVQFANCKRLSKDCNSFGRKLLLEIFSRNALSVCSMTGVKSNAFSVDGDDVRPGLDEYARTVLFTFVEEYGRERGWNVSESQSVVNSVRSKIQTIRAKYGKTK